MRQELIEIKKVIKTTKYNERSIITLDNLLEALKEAKERYGGDIEVQVTGCYGSQGEIEDIIRYIEGTWFDGILIVSDICSG